MNSLGLLTNKTITLDEFEEQLQLSLFEEFISFIESTKTVRGVKSGLNKTKRNEAFINTINSNILINSIERKYN
jgi:hypothetical protein